MSPYRSSEPQRLPLHPLAWPQLTCFIPSTPPWGCSLTAVYTLPVPSHHLRLLAEVHLTPQDGGQTRETGGMGRAGPTQRARLGRGEPPSWAGRQDGLPAALFPMSAVACGCHPSTRWGLPIPIRHASRSGAAWVLEDWCLWGGADAAGAHFLLSPCPEAAGPSPGLIPLRTGASLLPHGCRLHPVL